MKTKRAALDLVAAVLLGGAMLALACSQTEEVKPDPVEPKSQQGADAAPQPSYDWECPSETSGANLVLIDSGDGDPYCIDERETAYAEYKEFLEAKGEDTSGQPDGCEWNHAFAPDFHDELDCQPSDWKLETHPDYPVNCVDFCDAWMYCQWAGKRLCGLRGADNNKVNHVGVEEFDTLATSVQSEWFNVCSQGGRTKYPYGDAFQAGICTDDAKIQAEGDQALNVRDTSNNTCHGTLPPYDAVYDMSGSMHEWGNICRQGSCAIQGGYYVGVDPVRLACDDSIGSAARPMEQFATGIRCCADAVAVPRNAP